MPREELPRAEVLPEIPRAKRLSEYEGEVAYALRANTSLGTLAQFLKFAGPALCFFFIFYAIIQFNKGESSLGKMLVGIGFAVLIGLPILGRLVDAAEKRYFRTRY